MNFQDNKINEAKNDFKYLLNRGFPKKGALEFVGNHYLLKQEERNYLYRTVFTNKQMDERKDKLILLADIKDKEVTIDGYNVLITTESICNGEDENIVIGEDGVLRDINAVFGKYKQSETTEIALKSIIAILKLFKPKKILFFYDRPVSLSGELAKLTNEVLESYSVPGKAETCETVDFKLVELSRDVNRIIATSDSVIIDKVDRILDIPSYVSRLKGKKGYDFVCI